MTSPRGLRIATPSGTGERVQPCVNCDQPVKHFPKGTHAASGRVLAHDLWLHVSGLDRRCPEEQAVAS